MLGLRSDHRPLAQCRMEQYRHLLERLAEPLADVDVVQDKACPAGSVSTMLNTMGLMHWAISGQTRPTAFWTYPANVAANDADAELPGATSRR